MTVRRLARRLLRLGRGLAVALLAAACAGAPEGEAPPAPDAETAVLAAERRQEFFLTGYATLTLTAINDVDLRGRQGSVYRLAPGRHLVAYRYAHSALCLGDAVGCLVGYAEDDTIRFEARAGRLYRLHTRYRSGRLWHWIVDETTGRIVAGESWRGEDWSGRPRRLGVTEGF